jgi:hypothetical protein
MKAVTGQYECVHHSGVGLDYFTSRIDKLVLYPNGRFLLTIQSRSRAMHAARNVLQGQQAPENAPETRKEGSYLQHDTRIELTFDDGGFEHSSIVPNSEDIQIGPNLFTKVSDSTFLPPTHRLQQDMDDITKGLKIASAIGGFALKAAKTVQGATQSMQSSTSQPQTAQPLPPTQTPQAPQINPTPGYAAPTSAPRSAQPSAPTPTSAAPTTTPAQPSPIFCDQCGARARPGKRFCSNCGARLS